MPLDSRDHQQKEQTDSHFGLSAQSEAGLLAASLLAMVALRRPSSLRYAAELAEGKALTKSANLGKAELPTLQLSLESTGPEKAEIWKELYFSRTQKIQMYGGETSAQLHERLREQVTSKMSAVREPTQIVTPSWYTYDASKLLGVDNAVAVMTSSCKHETPYLTFVGIRDKGWMKAVHGFGEERWQYQLRDLGRELTEPEKNLLYDRM